MSTMTVTLSKTKKIAVADYADASRVIREDIAKRGVGASRWYGKGAGVIGVNGVHVAYVSYNGRVWKGVDDGKVGHEEITW